MQVSAHHKRSNAPSAAHCYADCAVSGSCEATLLLAVQLPAKFRVYTLVVCPFDGCPVPL